MAGNQLFERQLRHFSPHTYNALTKLVMAMAALTKHTGKKTLFGRDKGQESYSKFLEALKVTVQSMILDGLVKESTASDEVVSVLTGKLKEFELAHPNWQDAYTLSAFFFKENCTDAASVIEHLRGPP